MSIQIDTSDLTIGFERIIRNNTKKANKALGIVGQAIINDAVNVAPKPPVKTGLLRSSHFFQVGNKVVKGEKAKGASTSTGELELVVGFNTEYAAKIHETYTGNYPDTTQGRISKSRNTDSGKKFLSSKIERNRGEYKQILEREISGSSS